MPQVLKDFTFAREKKPARFAEILDGQIWKVHPDEFDYDSAKALIGAIKAEAKKVMNRYVQTTQTLDGHVVVRLQPDGYQPAARKPRVKKPGKDAA